MEYTQGTLGRVFVARLKDGESVYDAVHEIASREDIQSAAVMAVGGMRSGKVVTGPQNTTGKVVPHFEEFDDAREMVGFGTLFKQEGKPMLHMHAGIGRGDGALVGCPRGAMSVYLVLEVVIIELVGINATRELDPEYGVHLLSVLGASNR
jgi:predicted DNA-binding protein with PD1-like motif